MAMLRSCVKLLLIFLIWHFAANGWAQSYPVKIVRYLVPAAAGSGADTIGRIIAGGLAQVFGQRVIVDNRAGGGFNIGAEVAAKAPADGYTVLQIAQAHTVNVSFYRNLSYDLVRDFAPVTRLATSPYVLVVHPSLPVKSITELVKLARARPGAINYASTSVGGATFLAGELLKDLAKIDMLNVPYRGGGEALTSVISGETSVYFAPVAIALPMVREGRLRPLAVSTPKRLPMLPEYPTVAEVGYPGYVSGNFFGLVVPVKTPRETIATIHSAAVSVLNNPDVIKRLSDLGYVPIGGHPAEFAKFIKSDIEKWRKVIREKGLTAD